METINQQLDKLFNDWENKLPEDIKEKFCRDGLMLRPSGDDVNALWENASRRVVFLLKDKSDNSCDDIRTWLVTEKEIAQNNRELNGGKVGRTCFLPNIARMLYGLLNVSIDNPLGFEEVYVTKMDKVRETWNKKPVALIETKKVAGIETVSDAAMREALTRDNLLLQEELNILKPNIIVCCDANDSQFKFITEKYFAGKPFNPILNNEIVYDGVKPCCIYYYPDEKVAVIKSYHPTKRGKKNWMVYERVVCSLRKLLKEYPEPFEKIK